MRTYNLRLPDELYEQLKAQADVDQRSLNAEITWLLTQALNTERTPS